MDHDTLKASYFGKQDVEMQIARQCAPLLAGIKISNILIIPVTSMEKVSSIFCHSHIDMKCLHVGKDRVTILLYKLNELEQHLKGSKVQILLGAYGYEDMAGDSILDLFALRYLRYMEGRNGFPHEMGILLGYPIDDVIGFIRNGGKNSLYTGYWKVYSNLYEAIDTFERYNQAKSQMIQLVSNGVSIEHILEMLRIGEMAGTWQCMQAFSYT